MLGKVEKSRVYQSAGTFTCLQRLGEKYDAKDCLLEGREAINYWQKDHTLLFRPRSIVKIKLIANTLAT